MKTIRIALVEDNPTDMAALTNDFLHKGQIEVVHSFMTGVDFINHISDHKVDFDAVVIDYRLPLLNGIETCRNLIAKNAEMKHLLVSHAYYPTVMKEMMGMGSQNYCQKSSEIIHQILPRIIEGRITYEDATHISCWDELTRIGTFQTKDESYWINSLSPLEKKIIRYVSQGENSQFIAETLGYETSSIEKYRGYILKSLDLKNSQQLTAWAFSHGLINASTIFCNQPKISNMAAEVNPHLYLRKKTCKKARVG